MVPKITDIKLAIGGIVFSLSLIDPEYGFVINDPYTRFVVSRGEPDVHLRVHCGALPEFEEASLLFDPGGVWQLYRDQGKLIYLIRSGVDSNPILVAVLADTLKEGDIYLSDTWNDQGSIPLPFGYPFSEWLTISLLSQDKQGAVLHACGVSQRGEGLLFLGASGAGKSTMGSLWQNVDGVDLLSDDRVVLRRREDAVHWMYGSPWNGEAWIAAPTSVPLKALFLIRHAKENSVKRLEPTEAVLRLFLCSFPTFWDVEGTAFTLKFLEELARIVPCYELGFVPDMDAVEFIQEI